MIDLLILFALLTIFGGRGIILFLLYLLIKHAWPRLEQAWKQKKSRDVVDVDFTEDEADKEKKSTRKRGSPLSKSTFQDFIASLSPSSDRDKSRSFTLPPMQFPSFKTILKLLALLAIVLILLDGFTSIPAGHVGVIYDRGRGVLPEAFPEGLHLKIPFWQTVEKMDTRLQAYTMSIAPGEGQRYGDDSIESLSKDGQKVDIDITIQYRIEGKDAPRIYQTVGLDYRAKVVRPGARNVIRDIVTGYDSTKLFTQEARTAAQDQMRDQLRELYAKSHVKLENVLLRNIRFSEIYLQAIEDKQVAQQRIQMAEYEKLEAIELKEKKIIEAQAEAEAIRLKGETLRANPQVIQFEFVQKMADDISWGILPNDILPLIDLKRLSQ